MGASPPPGGGALSASRSSLACFQVAHAAASEARMRSADGGIALTERATTVGAVTCPRAGNRPAYASPASAGSSSSVPAAPGDCPSHGGIAAVGFGGSTLPAWSFFDQHVAAVPP